MTTWEARRSEGLVLIDIAEGGKVARLTLNRPEKRNALSHALIAAYLDALEELRNDRSIHAVITRAAGPSFSAGLDLKDVQKFHATGLADWDLTTPATRLYETVRNYPKVMVAQVHGYCVGGAVAFMSSHDIVVADADAQIGMPEILRGSFGQNVTAVLLHAGLPLKFVVYLQLSGENVTGAEAANVGMVSVAVEGSQLEEKTTVITDGLALRHPEALRHAKIAVQLGRDLPLPHALEIDRLVTARLRTTIDPVGDLDAYLRSQKGGADASFARSDI